MKINIPKRCMDKFKRTDERFSKLISFGLMENHKEYVTIDSDCFCLEFDEMYGAYLTTTMYDVEGNTITYGFGLRWELNLVETMPELIIKCDLENPNNDF